MAKNSIRQAIKL